MRLLFIAPCFESGKDGVGDYTRRLAQEIENAGLKAFFIAWNDQHINEVVTNNDTLRFPFHLSEKEKIQPAMEFIQNRSVDAISLQWVPYGYHPKGLFYPQLISLRKVIGNKIPLHLMIHEIWQGAKQGSPLKQRLIGFLQKILYRKMLKDLNPEVLSAQCKAYQFLLSQLGQEVNLLPLMGNISFQHNGSLSVANNTALSAGFFGSIHQEVDLSEFVVVFKELASKQGKSPVIKHAGRMSSDSLNLFSSWKEKWGDEIDFQALGEKSEEAISEYLQSLDFGLSPNPLSLIDKSGTVAAMREHKLPVVSLRNDVSFEGYQFEKTDPKLITELSCETFEEAMRIEDAFAKNYTVETVGKRFLKMLNQI